MGLIFGLFRLALSLLVLAFVGWYALSSYRRYTVTRDKQYLYGAVIGGLVFLVLARFSFF